MKATVSSEYRFSISNQQRVVLYDKEYGTRSRRESIMWATGLTNSWGFIPIVKQKSSQESWVWWTGTCHGYVTWRRRRRRRMLELEANCSGALKYQISLTSLLFMYMLIQMGFHTPSMTIYQSSGLWFQTLMGTREINIRIEDGFVKVVQTVKPNQNIS